MPEEKFFSYDEIREFVLSKMREYNISPANPNENIIIDGNIHRYKIDGHARNSKNGAYAVFSDGIPAGFLQDWTNPTAKYVFNMHSDGSSYSERMASSFNYETWKKEQKTQGYRS